MTQLAHLPPTAKPSLQAIDAPAAQGRTVLVASVLFAAASVYFTFANKSDIDLDATTHYMMARAAIHTHYLLVNVWGRPLCTLMYCLPAYFGGQIAARLMCLALAIGIALVTWRIAIGQQYRWPAVPVIFLYSMPLFQVHSFTTLTEIPVALVLGLAFWAYQKRVFWAMALLAGILPAGRPEGFGLVLLAIAALVLHRRFAEIVLALLPFILWNALGAYIAPMHGKPWFQWVFANWPYSADSLYGRGTWWSFTVNLWQLVGCFAVPFLVAGFIWCLPNPRRAESPKSKRPILIFDWLIYRDNPLARGDVWLALIPLGLLIIHSLIWWQGKLGSNGQMRYLLMAAPMWALASARGFEWLWPRLHLGHPMLWLAGSALLGLAYRTVIRHELPVPLAKDDAAAIAIVAWDQQHPQIDQLYPLVLSTNPALPMHMAYDWTDPLHCAPGGPAGVKAAPDGTLLIWDEVFALTNSDKAMVIRRELIGPAHWIFVGQCRGGGGTWEVYLSPRDIHGHPTVWTEPPFHLAF